MKHHPSIVSVGIGTIFAFYTGYLVGNLLDQSSGIYYGIEFVKRSSEDYLPNRVLRIANIVQKVLLTASYGYTWYKNYSYKFPEYCIADPETFYCNFLQKIVTFTTYFYGGFGLYSLIGTAIEYRNLKTH